MYAAAQISVVLVMFAFYAPPLFVHGAFAVPPPLSRTHSSFQIEPPVMPKLAPYACLRTAETVEPSLGAFSAFTANTANIENSTNTAIPQLIRPHPRTVYSRLDEVEKQLAATRKLLCDITGALIFCDDMSLRERDILKLIPHIHSNNEGNSSKSTNNNWQTRAPRLLRRSLHSILRTHGLDASPPH